MNHRTILLHGHIEAVQCLETGDGVQFTHLVLRDDKYADTLIKDLKAAGYLLYDGKTDDEKELDDKYKMHTFYTGEWK